MARMVNMGATVATLTLVWSIALGGAAPSLASDEVPITPELIQQADREAIADPLTDQELAKIADQLSEDAAAQADLSQTEMDQIDAKVESGELTAWVDGQKLIPDVPQETVNDSLSPTAISSTTAVYQPKTWGACGAFDSSGKTVRIFYINTVPYAYRPVYLKCGTSGWGYRHIKANHMDDWAGKALYVGANWREMADFAIKDALQHVYSGTYSAINRTYKYRGVVQLKRYDGRTMHTFYPVVVVSAGDYRIITSYPSNRR